MTPSDHEVAQGGDCQAPHLCMVPLQSQQQLELVSVPVLDDSVLACTWGGACLEQKDSHPTHRYIHAAQAVQYLSAASCSAQVYILSLWATQREAAVAMAGIFMGVRHKVPWAVDRGSMQDRTRPEDGTFGCSWQLLFGGSLMASLWQHTGRQRRCDSGQ